jgi:hypothetical protein
MLSGVCALALFVPAPHAAEPPAAKPADPSKVDGVKSPKMAIESPLKNLTATKASGGDFVNPKVAPGKIQWHAGFDSACAAASKSGKPVLLFQMMGKLDDQFC